MEVQIFVRTPFSKGKIICQTTPTQRKMTYDAEPSYVDFKL